MGMFLLQFIIIVGGLCVFSVMRASMRIWAPGFAVLLAAMTWLLTPPSWFLIICWILWALIVISFAIPELRKKIISQPTFRYMRKVLPPMSETERIALEAGNVWWEADLFCGRPDWQKLLTTQLSQLTAEEQEFIDNQVETLCNMVDDWKIVHEHRDLPEAVWSYLKQERFFGIVIPKEYGGRGFSAIAHSAMVIKIATRSMSTAVTSMVPNSLGPGELLVHYGTEQQKNYYLPRLARGEEIPCFGLTAPEAGSDATALSDTGIVCKGIHEGKEIIGIKLNFEKRYITLAPVATVIGVAFKLYDPDQLLGSKKDLGITLCLLSSKQPGVEVGNRHYPLRLAFMNGTVRGKDVFIPLDAVIGGQAMLGQGWRMLMECLSIGRSISLPGLSTASAQLCYRTTGAYAYLRRQFKLPIAKFEGVEEGLATIAGYTYILNATRHLTASAVDSGIKPSVASAIAKYHMTELARKVIDLAMDIHAGRGIQMGPRNYLGLANQAMPVAITVEGANILTRNLIIFGQGAVRCHPFVQAEMEAVAKDDIEQFDQLLFKHIGYAVSNFFTTFGYGIGGVHLITGKQDKSAVSGLYRQLTRMSVALAAVADMAMLILGGELKRKERLSARLGDVLSNLYLASAVLKYFHDQQEPQEDLPMVQWCVQSCLFNVQNAFEEFFANFPLRWLGRILRFVIFPWGRSYCQPKDALAHKLVQPMLQSSTFRDRITPYCFIGKNENDPVWRLEQAFQIVLAAEPLEKKLQQAVRDKQIDGHGDFAAKVAAAVNAKVLTTKEAEVLLAAERARLDAITVDEFKPEELIK